MSQFKNTVELSVQFLNKSKQQQQSRIFTSFCDEMVKQLEYKKTEENQIKQPVLVEKKSSKIDDDCYKTNIKYEDYLKDDEDIIGHLERQHIVIHMDKKVSSKVMAGWDS